MNGEPIGVEGRLARGWRLTKVAWGVVRRDPSIVLLTATGVVLTLAAAAAIFALSDWGPGDRLTVGLVLWSVAFAWPITFVATFVNVAVAASAAAALDGERLGVRDALAVSVRRLRAIAVWSLVAAGVGVIIEQVAERLPWGGRLFEWLAGAAWTIATLFVVPVLALEDRGVRDSLRRSAALIRERWGESTVGFASIGSSAVEEVFSVALYRYASGAGAAGPFTEQDLSRAVARRGD